jgi:hypothetical protein
VGVGAGVGAGVGFGVGLGVGPGPGVAALGHAPVFALARAVVTVVDGVSVTSAESCRPSLSVTTKRNVMFSVAGAISVTSAVLAPTRPGGLAGSTTDHA